MPPKYRELAQENAQLKERVAELENKIAWFQRNLFGSGKGEDYNHLQLLLKLQGNEVVQAEEPEKETITYTREKPKKKKRLTPNERFEKLPVKETVEVIPEEVKRNPGFYKKIGEERTYEVDLTPPRLFKREFIYPKYAHVKDNTVPPVIAPAPRRPVQGSYASAGLIAWITYNKYVNHLPLARQEKMSRHWGAEISRKTMTDWVQIVAEWLKPIYNLMRKELIGGDYLQADETPVRYNDPDIKNGKTDQGWLWVIGKPGSHVVFDWRLSRRHQELKTLIKGFKGVLQSDGYGAYKSTARDQSDTITLVGCFAHARRKFVEAMQEDPVAVRFVLRLFRNLYGMEKQWDQVVEMTPARRTELRQKDSSMVLKLLKKVAFKLQQRCPPKSNLGKACAYLISHWTVLTEHLNHGQTRIDNNLIENAIRPSALGKKNWMFVGHPDAGERTAIIYSIVVTCERFKIDPLVYLRDVLTRLPQMADDKITDYRPLLPGNWQVQDG